MNVTNIKEMQEHAIDSLNLWIEDRIEDFAAGKPALQITSPYLKRGVKNWMHKSSESISEMIDNLSMFVCDEDGKINIDTVFEDLSRLLNNEQEIVFGKKIPMKIGKGAFRIVVPDNPVTSFLLNGQDLIFNEKDLIKLKSIIVSEMSPK